MTGIGTIASALAIMAAGLLGREAVANFRRQKQVERQMAHAERTLAAAYRLDDAISSIRSPLSTSAELNDAGEELEKFDWFNQLDEQRKKRTVQTNVFYQRIRHFKSAFDEGLEMLPFVKAFFGDEEESALRELIRVRNSVRVYADAYSNDHAEDADFSKKIQSYIWEGMTDPSGNDPIKTECKKAISILEDSLLPIIRPSAGRESLAEQ